MASTSLTGADNKTYDIARICFLGACIVFFTGSIWVTYNTKTFDMQSFGIGFGALCTGVGGLLKLKENTEPKP